MREKIRPLESSFEYALIQGQRSTINRPEKAIFCLPSVINASLENRRNVLTIVDKPKAIVVGVFLKRVAVKPEYRDSIFEINKIFRAFDLLFVDLFYFFFNFWPQHGHRLSSKSVSIASRTSSDKFIPRSFARSNF